MFGGGLAALVGIGALVGRAVGPIDAGASGQTAATDQSDTSDGYTLTAADTQIDPEPFSFTITDADGRPVTEYDVLHEKELHLIVVSTGLRTYAHVHPERGEGGQWTIDLSDLPPCKYRAIADFSPSGGTQTNVAGDLVVPGKTAAEPPLQQALADRVDDLDITLDAAESDWSEVVITVRRGGEVITTEPYLGAAGHLVAIEAEDLAYLHTHALDEIPAGPVRFAVQLAPGATHALFFDFKVDGVVRTAKFVIENEEPDDDGTEHGH